MSEKNTIQQSKPLESIEIPLQHVSSVIFPFKDIYEGEGWAQKLARSSFWGHVVGDLIELKISHTMMRNLP